MSVEKPNPGYRQFRVGRRVYDRLPHPTEDGRHTPTLSCRAYYLPQSSRLLSVELTDPSA